MKLSSTLATSALLFGTVVPRIAAATTYTVTVAQTPSSAAPAQTGAAINANGDVAGLDNNVGAILMQSGARSETALPVFLMNGGGGEVHAIDRTVSQLVGWAWQSDSTGAYRQRPVLWHTARCKRNDPTCKNGFAIVDLGGFTSCDDVEARGINSTGLIVGLAQGSCTGTAWTIKNGVMSTLPPLSGGSQAAAFAVNDNAQIVGNSEVGGNTVAHATIWQNGLVHDLGALPNGLYSVASALNADGTAVGASTFGGQDFWTGHRHAVIFRNGAVTDLTPALPATDDAVALGINRTGQIVGTASHRATIWVNGVGTALDTLVPAGSGITLVTAVAINDNGVILANGSLPGDPSRSTRMFVLTPQ